MTEQTEKGSPEDWREHYVHRELLSLEEAACIAAGIPPGGNEGILLAGATWGDSVRARAFADALQDAAKIGKIHVGAEQDEEGNFLYLYHPHVRAWAKEKGINWPLPGECFGPGEKDPAPAPADEVPPAPGRAKTETQGDRIEALLQEIEKRANDAGVPFDRQAMPGVKGDLLALAHAWDSALRSIRTVESLSRYLSGRCKWPASAGAAPSARPLFARLFPDARIGSGGAVSNLRKTA